MQEFLAFIDKVRAQTRESSRALSLSLLPILYPTRSLSCRLARLSTALTPLYCPAATPLTPLCCVQNNLHIRSGKKKEQKLVEYSMLLDTGCGLGVTSQAHAHLSTTTDRQGLPASPFLCPPSRYKAYATLKLFTFCICAANCPILLGLFIAHV